MRSDALRRLVFGAAASATALAIVTAAIALFEPYVPVLSLGVLYLFAVLPIAVLFGIEFAIPVSVASMLAFNWGATHQVLIAIACESVDSIEGC